MAEKRANIQCDRDASGLEMAEPIEPAELCGTNFAIEENPPKKQCVRHGNSDMRKHIIVTAMMVLDSSSSESEGEEDDSETILSILLNGYRGTDIYSRLKPFLMKPKETNSVKLYMEEIVPNYSEEEFRRHFRISMQLFENLCDRFSNWETFKKIKK